MDGTADVVEDDGEVGEGGGQIGELGELAEVEMDVEGEPEFGIGGDALAETGLKQNAGPVGAAQVLQRLVGIPGNLIADAAEPTVAAWTWASITAVTLSSIIRSTWATMPAQARTFP